MAGVVYVVCGLVGVARVESGWKVMVVRLVGVVARVLKVVGMVMVRGGLEGLVI